MRMMTTIIWVPCFHSHHVGACNLFQLFRVQFHRICIHVYYPPALVRVSFISSSACFIADIILYAQSGEDGSKRLQKDLVIEVEKASIGLYWLTCPK